MKPDQIIFLAISGAEVAIKLVNSLIARAKQNAELTPEQEAEVDKRHKELMSQAHWQVEP